ncbi:MAG: helix-turn-helix domain-containing protein [Candidatus Pacebacteria bacterium]|nr:helix-turn-helix domain-containing protein [Candidatus Paceibacterota bacterium]
MITKKQLLEIGFTDKEAGVYLALLEMGVSTVSEISRKAGINRTTGYDILELLCAKGLVNALGEGKIKKYAAEDPQKMIALAQEKFEQTQKEFEAVKKILPELQSVFSKTEKPKVKFYEGRENIKQAFEDTLIAKESLIGYASADPMYESMPEFFPNYVKKRVARKISCRIIAPDTLESKKVASQDKTQLRESRLVPTERFNLAVEINIYDNKVMIASWKENLAILIESQKIADAQKKIFELAWEAAGKYKGRRT